MSTKSDQHIADATSNVQYLMRRAASDGWTVGTQNVITTVYNMLVDLADVEHIDDRDLACDAINEYVCAMIDNGDAYERAGANSCQVYTYRLSLAIAYLSAYGDPIDA